MECESDTTRPAEAVLTAEREQPQLLYALASVPSTATLRGLIRLLSTGPVTSQATHPATTTPAGTPHLAQQEALREAERVYQRELQSWLEKGAEQPSVPVKDHETGP